MVLGWTQAGAVFALIVGIAVSALGTSGWRSDVSAALVAPAEVAAYALFAVGMVLTVRFLRRGRRGSRSPFLLIQLFAVVVGNVLRTGAGAWPVIGWLVIVSGVVGVVLMFLPPSRDLLER